MLERTRRARRPRITVDRLTAGRTRWASEPRPKTGSQRRYTPKNAISRRASQKIGTAWPATAPTMASRSSAEPRLTAETMPAGIAIATAIRSAATVSSTVAGSRSRISAATGRLLRRETPRSPRAARAT